jgi:hypothetical protein
MSMVVDVTAIVLVLRVAVVDGECLTVVQHARQASEAPLASGKLRMGRRLQRLLERLHPQHRPGSVNVIGNTVVDRDGNEVVTNTTHGNLNCEGMIRPRRSATQRAHRTT